MINIPGYKTHEKCPITPGCTAQRIFESDADGKMYSLLMDAKDFIEHSCRVRGSEKPQVAYLGEWFNKRTNRTRWIGPARLETAVQRRPTDTHSSDDDWVYKGAKISKLDWMDT